MSSVSGISSSVASGYYESASIQRRQRPDPSQMAEDLFSRLDTSNKGYIEESDLETAFSSLTSSSTSSTSSASEVFSQLDSDGDGKVTEDELSSSLQTLAESLDGQFNQMRMQAGMPPPPPSDDAGFTEEELSSQLSEIGSTDSARSSLISSVLENFDAADTNADGKVSFQEAMSYDSANSTSTATDSSTTTASTSDTTDATTVASAETTDAQVFRQLMDLLRTYGSDDDSREDLLSSLISTAA